MAYRENYEHLIIEKNDGIALLTINRPESPQLDKISACTTS